jgi:cobyrinic acid a,c-diamide synthase
MSIQPARPHVPSYTSEHRLNAPDFRKSALSTTLLPRIVLAAASSDGGKTTVALGLIGALRRRRLCVRAAKVGPDFIDAAYLAHASGSPTRNLDAWLAPESVVVSSFIRGASQADISVIEGVMGLFDGHHGSGEGSTAHLARILGAPVILVLDCAKSAATIGAIAFGLAHFDPRVRVAGAILNRVGSNKHAATVAEACARAGVPVLGIVRRDEHLNIPSRHLGLIAPEETAWTRIAEAAADALERDVDLDKILDLARNAPALAHTGRTIPPSARRTRIALARDEAFWFYDEGSLEALCDAGAELIPYSPLRDPFPNDAQAAFIGGGYPELHAAALETNVAAREGLRAAAHAGIPVYAECGGLMYLGQALETANGTHAMAGVIPAISTMSPRRSALRYVEARALQDGPMFTREQSVRGHEFHYSRTRFEDTAPAYVIEGENEGYTLGNIHASYTHVHLGAYPQAVQRFISGNAHTLLPQ